MSELSIPAATVAVRDGKVITTSLKIAETFGKRHSDVLRAIEALEIPEDFNGRNFALVEFLAAIHFYHTGGSHWFCFGVDI